MDIKANARRYLVGGIDRVVALRRIEQSPLSGSRAVPAGSVGFVQDYADDLLWIDFGRPYGTVAVEDAEIGQAKRSTR